MNTAPLNVNPSIPRLNSPNRSQVDPNPRVIENLVPPDHPVRFIWEVVQGLDMEPLYAQIKSVEGHPGHPAIDPRLLTALWMYATQEGISSARRLAELCYEDDPFKWLRGGVDVNYHTLADFRVEHEEWLKQQVVTQLAAMRAEGLVDLDKVAQDGMRVRASAGSDSFHKQETLERLLQEAEQEWERLQEQFEEADGSLSLRQKAARQRAARERIERLRQAIEEVRKVAEAREKRKKGDGTTARASSTDPTSRRMKMGDGGTRPAYNVEFATDLESLVIVGSDVSNAGTDAGQMEPMVEQIDQEQGTQPREYYVDNSFATREDITAVERRGITVYSPVKKAEQRKAVGEDPYAPQRDDKSEEVLQWRKRMGTAEAQEKYKQRGKCEWSNAQCRNHGLQQFLVRGLAKVRAVVHWYVLVHNMLRQAALRALVASRAA